MTGNPTLEAARKYLDFGWSCIPVTPFVPGDDYRDGKHPDLDSWLPYQRRQPLLEEVEYWFADPAVPRNIGIVCGSVSHNLVVIDCDDMDTYRALVFAMRVLGKTMSVKTGKGVHIYTYTDKLVATTTFKRNGLTHHVKSDGQQVVAPPSRHASGHVYAWMDEPKPLLRIDPEALAAAILAIGGQPAQKAGAEGQSKHPPGWAAQLLRDGARSGERDDKTIALAGHLSRPWDGGLPPDTVEAILEIWAGRCDQPWGPRDIHAKVRALGRYPNAAAGQP